MQPRPPTLAYSYCDSPIGPLLLAGAEGRLRLISFPSGSRAVEPSEDWVRDDAAFAVASAQLQAYFSGALTRFELPLHLESTIFRTRVWSVLREIPYGATISYRELALRIGKPSASRAVGAANGANPLPIVIPCHRVIGSNRALTGFGGGLEAKRFLLDHERNSSR